MSNPTELPDWSVHLEVALGDLANSSSQTELETAKHCIRDLFARHAQPEGEAPQAAPLSEVQIDRIARAYFSEQWAVQHAKDAIHDAFEDARKSVTLSPLCGAQHAESGKDASGWKIEKDEHGRLCVRDSGGARGIAEEDEPTLYRFFAAQLDGGQEGSAT